MSDKFKNVIKKLKASDISIKDFAFEDWGGNINDFPEAVEARKIREDYVKNRNGKLDIQEHIEYKNLPNEYTVASQAYCKKNNIPNWKEIYQYGGEGQGDMWYSVKYFPDLDLYIRVDGWHQSYSGTEFSNDWYEACREVRPQEKVITVYE